MSELPRICPKSVYARGSALIPRIFNDHSVTNLENKWILIQGNCENVLMFCFHKLKGLVDGSTYFGTNINLETVPIWFLIFYIRIPQHFWNSSGLHQDLWIEKEFVYLPQSAQNLTFCPNELPGQFI